MLAAAAYALNMAENSVPASADAQFQAGLFMGFMDVDIRAQMVECFVPDQKLADDTDAFIAAIKERDLDTIKRIVKEDEPLALKDTETCTNDPKYKDVKAAYDYQIAVVKKAKADPDWQIHAIKDIKPHFAEIKQLGADAQTQWALGTDDGYYNAGVNLGKIDKMVFAYWTNEAFFLQ